MVLTTKLTKALGIAHPIIQGGMHYVGYAPLAAAVSNGGGLGIVTALTQPSPEKLREEIQKTRTLLKDPSLPIGVNLTVIPMLKELDHMAYADVIISEKVEVLETAGSPKCADIWKVYKDAHPEFTIIHKCCTTKHALKAQSLGVDMISLDGFECAGHPGEYDIGNFMLQALGAKALDIPFVCSGGVGNGAQLAAALALGAEGVNMGTRFMATVEAPIHDGIKKALVDGNEYSTELIMRSVRNTERVYKNETSGKVREIEETFPGDFSKFANLVKGENYRRSFQETGNTEDSIWSAGCVMGLIDDVPTCKDLMESMVADAETIIKQRLNSMVE